jgi:hypothetical protein
VREGLKYDWSAAFVRNPYDRIFSAYKMFKYGTSSPPKAPHIQMEDMVDILIDDSIPYDFPMHRSLDIRIRHHILPMTHPYNCLEHAKTIYRFENYEESVNEIMKRLQIQGKVPHRNKSRSRVDYRSAITPAMKEKIDKVYEEDLARFGYEW